MYSYIRSGYQKEAMQQYIREYFTTEVEIKSIPDRLITYQEKAMLDFYQGYADYYEMELVEFLNEVVGIASVKELHEENREYNLLSATYSLVVQAVAEKAGIKVNDDDLTEFFIEYIGSTDVAYYEEEYGRPYLMQAALNQKVLDYIIANAIFL